MILYVVRHGQTDFNIQQRYAGSTDVELNTYGKKQAEELSESIANMKFDVIITSSLKRARQTADIIGRAFPEAPIIIMSEFNERNIGVFEGLTRDEVKTKFPQMYNRNCTRQLDDAPDKGETIRQFDERIAKALETLIRQYKSQKVLLVSHGFVSRIINRQVRDLSFSDMHGFVLENCQVVEYNI